jgi:type IV secretion system protein VirB4
VLTQRNDTILARERPVAAQIPITAHVDEHVVRTRAGHYVQAFRLGGVSYESVDDASLNNWHERLNVLWRNIASPHLALWAHVIRRRERVYPGNQYPPGFAHDLNERYRQRLAGETLMVNEIVLSLVYRPTAGAVTGATAQLLARADASAEPAALRDALDHCAKRRQELITALARYDPEPLTLYVSADGMLASQLAEFYAQLVNGESQRIPLPRGPLNEAIATSRPVFGQEAMEYRMPVHTRLAAFLSIKEYRSRTSPGVFNSLLTAPFPFVLTQSFTFVPKATAQELMTRQLRRLRASGDLALSQADELHDALDDLASNRFVVGDHHFTLQVQTDPVDGGAERGPLVKQLNDHVAHARYLLGDAGIVVAREDLALEAAFWAQLPGNFRFRPRKATITSRNFAAMVPFHNHPTGRPTGNHWGNALTMFVTTARSPLYFSLHASDPRAPDGGSRKDVGHLVGIGPTGGGKTTLIGHLVALTTAFDATQVVFDHQEGLHTLVRALGGRYLPFKNGQPTGANPLQLPEAPDTREFLRQWLRRLVLRPGESLSVRQEEDLDHALRGALSLDRAARRLSRLVEFLDATDPEGLHARLKRWCASTGGDYAWVFDNPSDEIAPLLDQTALIGFDASDFLDNPAVRDPVAMTLFHLVQRQLDGRRLVVWADEFARLLTDDSFATFARTGLETWRKKEAALAAFTQSPSHVLGSPIARAIVEQTPTKIFFPNPDADRNEYTEGFSLTEREFALIKQELEPGARCFLVKQGHVSAVAKLDLKGCDDELSVLSGRTANLPLMHAAIARHGAQPSAWLPHYQAAVRQRQSTSQQAK